MNTDTDRPEFLTTREVAALLRVRERKVYDLAAAGAIPCRRVTGKLLFPMAEVEAWLAGGGTAAPAPAPAHRAPAVVAGSHDPLLDWALRESGSGLASFFDGSLDGLDRLADGEAIACGLHVFEPETGGWNLGHAEARLGSAQVVLIEWARRDRGLILGPGLEGIAGIAGLRGRRVALRQPKAGGQILFDHLMAEAGMTRDDILPVAAPARTETDAALAVASGRAEAAPGLAAMARQHRLGFLPLVTERYDIAIDRRAYFEPRWQALVAFCRSPAFAAKAAELGGYDLSGHGRVHWNGP
jgi:excisionase family DNA binding protein